ncbi:MAG: Fe-Mn family superoxide dismutase, partial [Crocinitomicaceae bacterium]
EHAYYLKYQNKRGDYLNSIWKLIDWQMVSSNFLTALNDPLLKEIADDTWPEIKEFHKVMSQTFHPAEKDDLLPLQARSGEMLAKAILLKESVIPVNYQKPEIKAAMLKLVKDCDELDKLVKKNAKKIVLKTKIIQAHDTFHVIQGLCKD